MTTLTSRVLALPVPNIDTDQIIPARYLKITDKAGLGDALFADWRYHADGSPRTDFILNQPAARDAQVLLAGDNFGCGSSREHAPWALAGFGFRAVISTFFADIFRSNALNNGLLPIVLEPDAHAALLAQVQADPAATVHIDVAAQTLTLPDGTLATFPLAPFARHCLLHGVDALGFLAGQAAAIDAYEAGHPARIDTGGIALEVGP